MKLTNVEYKCVNLKGGIMKPYRIVRAATEAVIAFMIAPRIDNLLHARSLFLLIS